MIHKYTGTCLYCGKVVRYKSPWHSECWLAEQRRINGGVPEGDLVPTCEIKGCEKEATTYTKIFGLWYRVCGEHKDEGWSLDRSLQHVDRMLDGEPA